jgi:hypothetical protein
MATAKTLYAVGPTAFTITLASLASFGAREGTAVSNTTNLGLDVTFSGKVTAGAAVPTGDCYLLAGSFDGNNYSYPLTGADANVTLSGKAIASLAGLQYGQLVPGTGLIFLEAIPTYGLAATTAVPFPPVSISQAFQMAGLTVPESFSPVIVNCQGQAFDATAGHFAVYYTVIEQTIA